MDNMESKISKEETEVTGIPIQEVQPDDPDYKEALEVTLPSNVLRKEMSEQEVTHLVEEKIIHRTWWLQEAWKNKGIPKEQISIKLGQYSIEVYNDFEPLIEKHVEIMKNVFETFAEMTDDKIFDKVRYILIDNY
jgi:hypothetical protein